MKNGLIYIHGKGGNAKEAEHYKPLFPEYDVVGLNYSSQTPWDAEKEFPIFFNEFQDKHETVILVANSIGAYFVMHALAGQNIERAFFISPIVDMEKLITDMMQWAGVSEQELMNSGCIETAFGETLSWEYLFWVRENPVTWNIPTQILYGEKDNLQSIDTIKNFADKISAKVTVMKNGEHWFHTQEQMDYLDDWLQGSKRNEQI